MEVGVATVALDPKSVSNTLLPSDLAAVRVNERKRERQRQRETERELRLAVALKQKVHQTKFSRF